jgi:hypothetical protein
MMEVHTTRMSGRLDYSDSGGLAISYRAFSGVMLVPLRNDRGSW